MVRTISFVQSQVFRFEGTMCQEAITLADFDNDSLNELCIGNIAGDLAVFKGSEHVWKAQNLGMITCLGVGDIKNKGVNSLVVITGEGLCYVFDHDCSLDSKSSESKSASLITHNCRQKLPLNIKQLIIADVTNRGLNDLIVILDTVVRIYAWDAEAEEPLKHQDHQYHNFEQQIDAITVNTSAEGLQSLFVCIPSEGIKILRATRTADTNEFMRWELVHQVVKFTSPVTDAIGDIRKCGGTGDNMVSFATMDGILKMYQGDEELWSIQLGSPIFALVKTDIDKDETDELVACSWDGLTFFVDHHKNCVRYKFEETVKIRAFCAGQYAIGGSKNKPALVYVTFSGDVVIKYDVELTSLGVQTLHDYPIDLSAICDTEHLSRQHRAKIVMDLLSPKAPSY